MFRNKIVIALLVILCAAFGILGWVERHRGNPPEPQVASFSRAPEICEIVERYMTPFSGRTANIALIRTSYGQLKAIDFRDLDKVPEGVRYIYVTWAPATSLDEMQRIQEVIPLYSKRG